MASGMDQKSIVFYPHLKGTSAQAIHNDLVVILGAQAPADSRVTKYLHTARFDPAKDPLNSDTSLYYLDDSDRAILGALEENRFRQCGSSHEPSILHALPFTED
jgi:hypothetical protein